jgi:hypothetical protein
MVHITIQLLEDIKKMVEAMVKERLMKFFGGI